MRTRPLPNRHAHHLSLFAETIQATLNQPRNRVKGPLEEMSWADLDAKEFEESAELNKAVVKLERLIRAGAHPDDIQQACADVEGEAADLAISAALSRFIKAREFSRRLRPKERGK